MCIYTPTWLYIKEHSTTGLRYFGKTVKDPLKYSGSGTRWLHHLRKHGKEHVTTVWSCLFTSREELIEFATFFSEEFNIVKSNHWANLCPESGTDGGYRQNNYFIEYNKIARSDAHNAAISNAKKGKATKQFPVTINSIYYPSMVNASRSLKVSEQTIYRWVKHGKAVVNGSS